MIEEEPRDLLGPTHERLVMHYLSEVVPSKEVSTFTLLRTKLEDQLSQWLLFECEFKKESRLAGEIELPQQALDNVLQQASEDVKVIVIESLKKRPVIPSNVTDLASPWLGDNVSQRLSLTVLRMLIPQHKALPSGILKAAAARLEDGNSNVRWAAVEALQGQSALPKEILEAVAARLEDEDSHVKKAAVDALLHQSGLPFEIPNRSVKFLYRTLLERSFREYLSCYIAGGIFFMAVGDREIPLKGQQGRFSEAIRET